MKVEQVMERVFDRRRLRLAWKQVQKNAGAAGIDRVTVQEFAQREEDLLDLIGNKLRAGQYRFKPARRKLIAKEGTSKKRKLGIPTVMDRVAGTSAHLVLEEIFDPDFTSSNFGFRRGRSQPEGRQPCETVGRGRTRMVCFDRPAELLRRDFPTN